MTKNLSSVIIRLIFYQLAQSHVVYQLIHETDKFLIHSHSLYTCNEILLICNIQTSTTKFPSLPAFLLMVCNMPSSHILRMIQIPPPSPLGPSRSISSPDNQRTINYSHPVASASREKCIFPRTISISSAGGEVKSQIPN